jgi:glycosyltransferase involved in cell wall biosynthesis
VDLRCLETPSGGRGVGRYARELTRALLAAAPPGWELAALSWSGVGAGLGLRDIPYAGPRRGIGIADRYLMPPLLRREGIDLYHSPAYALPSAGARGVALVLTVHDLVARLYPEALSWRHRQAFRRTFRSASVAHRIVAVSETTRRDLLAHYPLESSRVVAVPNGVAEAVISPAGADAASAGIAGPFLFYAGGLDPLKNVPFLLRVLGRCRERGQGLRLVIAGEEGTRRDDLLREARSRGLGDSVLSLGHVDEATLGAAYRAAFAFVFPSRYEGFGLPPLEAMAAGCPVVSSPAGALAEVLGDAALLAGPDDVDGWADALGRLERDPSTRARMISRGRERARGYSWARSARETLEVYRQALEEAGRA